MRLPYGILLIILAIATQSCASQLDTYMGRACLLGASWTLYKAFTPRIPDPPLNTKPNVDPPSERIHIITNLDLNGHASSALTGKVAIGQLKLNGHCVLGIMPNAHVIVGQDININGHSCLAIHPGARLETLNNLYLNGYSKLLLLPTSHLTVQSNLMTDGFSKLHIQHDADLKAGNLLKSLTATVLFESNNIFRPSLYTHLCSKMIQKIKKVRVNYALLSGLLLYSSYRLSR